MTFDRSNFPPITEDVEALILGNNFALAVKKYREEGLGLVEAKKVIEFERDRLLKDRSLNSQMTKELAHQVRYMLEDMITKVANQLCVTRAHVLDHVAREAAKALARE